VIEQGRRYSIRTPARPTTSAHLTESFLIKYGSMGTTWRLIAVAPIGPAPMA
jgi:hypothetical protein